MLTASEWSEKWRRRRLWQAVCDSPLGRNLAAAGALCVAYNAGISALEDTRRSGRPRRPWYPGCGREVPR